LCPTDRLCHTLGETAWGPARRNLRWACDAYLLLSHAESLDFAAFVATADELGLALPSAALLEVLHTRLGVFVPETILGELWTRGVLQTSRHTKLLLSMALRSSESVEAFTQNAKAEGALRRKAVRFALFPSAQHILYQRPARTRLLIPVWHVLRAARFLLRPVLRGGWLRRGSRRAELWLAAENSDAIGGGTNREN
jgi:hypothetical protein